MDEIPPFDPSKPFTEIPPFDPSKPFATDPLGMTDADREVAKINPGVQGLMQAFDTRLAGFRNEWGPEAFGLSERSQKWLTDKGVLPKDSGDTGFLGLKAFNEAMILPAAAAIDAAMRTPQVAFHALQKAATDVGIPRDVAALPEAFPVAVGASGMGGVPRVQLTAPKPFVKPVEIQPTKGSPNPGMPNSVSAMGVDPLVDKILQHPVMREVIDNPVVDDSHVVPNSWGGSEPITNPTLYRDHEFPKTMTVDGVTIDTAHPAAIHENVEQFAMDLMVKGGMDEATALKVAFWHFGEPAEDAFYTARGIDHEKAEAAIAPYVDRIADRALTPDTLIGAFQRAKAKLGFSAIKISDLQKETGASLPELHAMLLAEARKGNVALHHTTIEMSTLPPEVKNAAITLPGKNEPFITATLKDQALQSVPPDLFKGTYPDGDPAKAAPGPIDKPTFEEVAQGRAIIQKYFDENPRLKLEAEARGVPYPEGIFNPSEARALGVIGPEKTEPTVNDSPSELAARAIPRGLSSEATSEALRGGQPGHKPGEYDQRGKEWIDKIDEPEHVRDVIEKVANDHDFFPEARGGVASPAARVAVAEAAGVDPADIDSQHFATHFDNDGKVRAVIQVLRQTTKDFIEASEKAVKEPSIENAAAATEAEMRHTHVLEYTMGLRAESGRTLAAWKDLLRQTERSKAKIALKSGEQTGDVPAGTSSIVDAAGDVQENLGKAGQEGAAENKLGLQKLIDAARDLVGKEDEAGVRPAPLSPELAGLVDAARKTLNKFGATDTALDKLVDRAEKQAIDMIKTRAVKNPIEALPPELQALVDKAQRVVNRFGGIAKGEKAAMLLARTGRTEAEQEQLARSVAGLTPNQVASVLNKLRTSPEAKQPGWFYWLWQQGLISGLVTHIGYVGVNTATVFTERVISPTLGAVMGKVRGQNVSVMAPIYSNVAMVHSLPDAFTAAGEAFRTGNRIPLASEMRLFERGEESPQSKGAGAAYVKGPSPDWGIWKRVFNEDQLDSAAKGLGIPGRAANMIHTFYKVLSERAAASTRAYETAFQEGATGDKFWQRYQYHLDNPTDEALRDTVTDAYTGAFMNKLGPKTAAWASALQNNPVTKWLFPFQHIPWNIERMSMEYSPFAVLGPEMRSAILGKKGAPAQNLAIAKMVIGSSVIGYFIHKELADEATADYPTDPKERREWNMLHKQPNSIQIGGQWVNLERLGPAGNVAHMGASIGSIIRHYDGQDDDALTSAIWASSVAAANQIGNEVGFQTLRNVFDALSNKKRGEEVAAQQVSSLMYPSSFLSQNASLIDPYQRKANDLVSGLKYRVPFLRETLPPKLDPLYGEPLPNPAYHAIKRTTAVNTDPVKMELDRLGMFPGPPEDRIGDVKLPPALYDQYQRLAGATTRMVLEQLISQPWWHDAPAWFKADQFKNMIDASRAAARTKMQIDHLDIPMQGVENIVNRIEGNKPTKLKAP